MEQSVPGERSETVAASETKKESICHYIEMIREFSKTIFV